MGDGSKGRNKGILIFLSKRNAGNYFAAIGIKPF
jgi:hypothetical protein